MPYNETLADRVRESLADQKKIEEKRMMGGLTFMVNKKMCVGILHDDLMVRIDPAAQEELLDRTGCREMDFTGRPMKGFLFIDPSGTTKPNDLKFWLEAALDFNSKAKASKKKTKKKKK
jgi:TfoX/Sxy family transcriptional regulator of competence genes